MEEASIGPVAKDGYALHYLTRTMETASDGSSVIWLLTRWYNNLCRCGTLSVNIPSIALEDRPIYYILLKFNLEGH